MIWHITPAFAMIKGKKLLKHTKRVHCSGNNLVDRTGEGGRGRGVPCRVSPDVIGHVAPPSAAQPMAEAVGSWRAVRDDPADLACDESDRSPVSPPSNNNKDEGDE